MGYFPVDVVDAFVGVEDPTEWYTCKETGTLERRGQEEDSDEGLVRDRTERLVRDKEKTSGNVFTEQGDNKERSGGQEIKETY